MEEVDLKKNNWEQQLIRKHGAAGAIDRKRASLRRQAKRRFAARGLVIGTAVGVVTAVLLWAIVWGW